MSTIDRIFCTTELEAIFPLCTSQALPRTGSDHTPLLWDSGLGTDLGPLVTSLKNGGCCIVNSKSWPLRIGLLQSKVLGP